MMRYPFVLCISDTQEPFSHRDALRFAEHCFKTFGQGFKANEKLVIHVGDEVDQHTLSRWASNPNGRSAGDELKEAIHRLSYWHDTFPRVYVCESNHTYRAYKKGYENGIPKEFFRGLEEVYELPGWKWNEHWEFDGVIYEHGENVSGPNAALNAALQNRRSTVIGHQHTFGGVQWSGAKYDAVYGLNTGCLIDIEQYAFDYGKKLRKKPTLGLGVIVRGIPMFIPMFVDKRNRWVGRTL